MPCYPMRGKNGGGFICTSGVQEKLRCSICGRPATCLCDYRDMSSVYETDMFGSRIGRKMVPSISLCSEPLCAQHAFHAGPNEDYCPEHSSEFQIMRSRKAEELHVKRCKACGIEYSRDDE